jgi:hypothetical protein
LEAAVVIALPLLVSSRLTTLWPYEWRSFPPAGHNSLLWQCQLQVSAVVTVLWGWQLLQATATLQCASWMVLWVSSCVMMYLLQ